MAFFLCIYLLRLQIVKEITIICHSKQHSVCMPHKGWCWKTGRADCLRMLSSNAYIEKSSIETRVSTTNTYKCFVKKLNAVENWQGVNGVLRSPCFQLDVCLCVPVLAVHVNFSNWMNKGKCSFYREEQITRKTETSASLQGLEVTKRKRMIQVFSQKNKNSHVESTSINLEKMSTDQEYIVNKQRDVCKLFCSEIPVKGQWRLWGVPSH